MKYVYRANQANFEKIPGSPIAYWASKNLIHDFEIGTPMSELLDPRQGLATADNNRFLRQWFEVQLESIKFDAYSIEESVQSKRKWFPYNKGGAYRKWYGNYDYVVNWENDGEEIRNFKDSKGKVRSRPQNTDYYFREAITWSLLTSFQTNVRFREVGSIHDVNGMSAFGSHDELLIVMGLVNSAAGLALMAALNPTLAFQVGDFQRLPLIDVNRVTKEELIDRVKSCIIVAKKDWNLSENSWSFLNIPLIFHIAEHTLSLLRKIARLCAHVPKMCQRIIRLFKRSVC